MRIFYRPLVAAGLLLAVCGAGSAAACALDQTPSVYANGQLAGKNPSLPTTQAQLKVWTYFIFTRTYPMHHAITFTENRREVAQTLKAVAMRRPWRWHFGDGQIAYGWTVRHTYAHAGRWRIVVDAYLPSAKQWYEFDQVTITVK